MVFWPEMEGADHKVNGGSEAGFTQMKELQVRREGRIARVRRQWRRSVPAHQVFHDGDRLDHRHVAVLECGDEAGGVDGQKLGILLDSCQ